MTLAARPASVAASPCVCCSTPDTLPPVVCRGNRRPDRQRAGARHSGPSSRAHRRAAARMAMELSRGGTWRKLSLPVDAEFVGLVASGTFGGHLSSDHSVEHHRQEQPRVVLPRSLTQRAFGNQAASAAIFFHDEDVYPEKERLLGTWRIDVLHDRGRTIPIAASRCASTAARSRYRDVCNTYLGRARRA